MGRNAKLKEKHNLSDEKPKFDNAKRLRGICFIDPEDKEVKETIKNARKKLETPMAPAMPCKTSKTCKHGETCGENNEFKSKHACILEANESTRIRMEESLSNYHEDHIAGKGNKSLQHFNLVHKFYSYVSSQENSRSRSSSGWGMGETGKDSSVGMTKVRSKSEVIDEAKTREKFILLHCWTSVIWRMPTWRQSTKNTMVELYSETILWKMDLMQYLQNKDHQYHKWLQQKSWIISRLPGCSGQAADAVSACTQVKMEDAPKLLKIPKSECPDIWIRLPRHKWPESSSSMEDPVVPLERNLYGHLLAALLWWRQFEKFLLKYGWESFQLGLLTRTPWKRNILICVCGWCKIGWKEQNIDPMWKALNKEVDLEEPTSFLDHVYLDCTQRSCEISKDVVDNYRTMSESRISAGATEKLPCSENLSISSWSYDMEGHAKICVERYCELANRTTQQLYKVSTPCIDDHHFKEKELKSVGELSKEYSQIVLKCLYLARIGRSDIRWSVNKLARSITKWTKACDKWLSRLISCIRHTCD